jgi:hypothetical protein
VALHDLGLKVQSVDVGKLNIQDQTGRYIRFRIRDVLGSRTERHHTQIAGREKIGQRLADPAIVIHHEEDVVL